jgi:glycosyltransferase involved in cell wall biosynthesis
MRFTVIIATYNRAEQLDDTLDHLARITTVQPWEVLVVDNSSSDDTPNLIERRARDFPVALRYLLEPTQGKYAAMNSGIRASRGEIIAATDDDARVAPDWLDRAEAGLLQHGCGFVGGPVRPLWDGPPPAWLDKKSAVAQKVIAICDYGPSPREYGVRLGWPLGVNVAYRREVFEDAGLFDPSLGRKAGTLRSQAQREWHLRARAAGIKGFYLPDMMVDHQVIVERLHKQYFRRWYYWHGISRANLYWRSGVDPEEPEALRHMQPLEQIGGVPRRLLTKAVKSARSWAWRSLRGDSAQAFEYEMWLCFFAGLTLELQRLSREPFKAAPAGRAPRPHGADQDDSDEPVSRSDSSTRVSA